MKHFSLKLFLFLIGFISASCWSGRGDESNLQKVTISSKQENIHLKIDTEDHVYTYGDNPFYHIGEIYNDNLIIQLNYDENQIFIRTHHQPLALESLDNLGVNSYDYSINEIGGDAFITRIDLYPPYVDYIFDKEEINFKITYEL